MYYSTVDDEIEAFFNGLTPEERKDWCAQYGTPRHSGRYPWGSGKNPQRHKDFRASVKELQDNGITSEKDICNALQMTVREYRAKMQESSNQLKADDIQRCKRLYSEKQMSVAAISRLTGIPDSTVRNYVKDDYKPKTDVTDKVIKRLQEQVNKQGYVDVGTGVELYLTDENFAGKISEDRLIKALDIMKDRGYTVETISVEQLNNPGNRTSIKVLAKPGSSKKDILKNQKNIHSIEDFKDPTVDVTAGNIREPVSLDSSRVFIRYSDKGGKELDGTIQVRKGVEDIEFDGKQFAQVRITVDGTHYLKGVAVYSNDIPDGYDVVFNTNKPSGTPKEEVFKPLKPEKENPYGATIKNSKIGDDGLLHGGQHEYIGKDGQKHLSVVNKVNEEGDWDEWSRTVSSQMLSKQPLKLINQQLDLTYKEKKQEFDEICALTNPVVKKKMLESFADDCDSSAVHLKATAFPGQKPKLLLSASYMKDDEIYAPDYDNGTTVALIRYPHEGTFEIPVLKVNNNVKQAKENIGNAVDAVGINYHVAAQLSGADFDGDTVVVIPFSDKVQIKAQPYYEGLKNFSTDDYKFPKGDTTGRRLKKGQETQTQMGIISNLITDMTLQGAPDSEIERATKHSMVIIDAVKHDLDWKRSYEENRIAELQIKYQGKKGGGASTLISRASSEYSVPDRKEGQLRTDPVTGKTKMQYIDPETGAKLYTETGRTKNERKKVGVDEETGAKIYANTGKDIPIMKKSTKMYEVSDARLLLSGSNMKTGEIGHGHPKEEAYANYANAMKALGNQARKEQLATGNQHRDPEAAKIYATEVSSLNAKLNIALKNAPKERYAEIVATYTSRQRIKANPSWTEGEVKRARAQALSSARNLYGAHKSDANVIITDKEWEAIQAGAVSQNTLEKIVNNTDLDRLKQLATPHSMSELSSAKQNKIRTLAENGKTIAEIAEALGVSTSTVSKYLKQ